MKVLTSNLDGIYSCIRSSASSFHMACTVATKASYVSILITPTPCVPVSVFNIIGNLPPIISKPDLILLSLDINAVFGVGKPNFSNNKAVVSLLSQVSIAALVFNINACEF